MAEKNDKEEELDFITPYLEKIGLEKRERKPHREHFEVSSREVVKDFIEVMKKERRITAVVTIEIILTIILILMLAGIVPFF